MATETTTFAKPSSASVPRLSHLHVSRRQMIHTMLRPMPCWYSAAVVLMVPFFWMLSTSLKTLAEVQTWPIVWIPSDVRLGELPGGVPEDAVRPLHAEQPRHRHRRHHRHIGRQLAGGLRLCPAPLSGPQFPLLPEPDDPDATGLGGDRAALHDVQLRWAGSTPICRSSCRPFSATRSTSSSSANGSWASRANWKMPRVSTAARHSASSPRSSCRSSKPVIATVAIFAFFYYWNDLLYPLVYLQSQMKFPVSLGLRMFQTANTPGW